MGLHQPKRGATARGREYQKMGGAGRLECSPQTWCYQSSESLALT